MYPRESHRLRPGMTIWVWVVRLGRGRWWPGTVESLRTIQGRLRVAVRFECRRARGADSEPALVGKTTTAMRYLEIRNIDSRDIDRPTRPPVSLLQCPEEVDGAGNERAGLSVGYSSTAQAGVASTSSSTSGDFKRD
jgi:hypothetical protein